jgi:cobalt/nickel transport system permease protein
MMLRGIDACAHTNRWRANSGPVALLCAGLMACVLLAPPMTAGPLVGLTAAGVAMAGAGVPVGLYVSALVVPAGFLAMGSLALCVTLGLVDGRPVLGFSADGAWIALETALRAGGAVAVTLCFACIVSTAQLVALLRRAGVPEALLDLLQLVHRTLFVFDTELATILRAQDNRLGFRTWRVALRSAGRAGAALFVRSLQRAAQMERGLAARGYTDRLPVLPPRNAATLVQYALAGGVPVIVAATAILLHLALRGSTL